jgi:predicted RNase H-like HicB family nuclease
MPKPPAASRFSLAIEYYREEDGRWLADIAILPGVTAYGRTRKLATAALQAALRLIADRLEHGETVPGPMDVSFIAADKPSCGWRFSGSAGASNGGPLTASSNAPAGPTYCSRTTTGSLLVPRL